MPGLTYSARFKIPIGENVTLSETPSRWEGDAEFQTFDQQVRQVLARQMLEQEQSELAIIQDKLYADNRFAVLIILEGMTGADLDGVIQRVISGVNPQGCSVSLFRKPSDEEQDHDFLWRYFQAMPGKGHIKIFKRSYYSELASARIKPEVRRRLLSTVKTSGESFWRNTTRSINTLEHHLSPSTLILKFFLHISKQEQTRRFLEWMEDPAVRWRFNGVEREQHDLWDEYQDAFQAVINATHTRWAPWYVIPTDADWVAHTLVADILTDSIQGLDVNYPELSEEQKAELEEGRQRLESE